MRVVLDPNWSPSSVRDFEGRRVITNPSGRLQVVEESSAEVAGASRHIDAHDKTHESLSSSRPLGSIQRDGKNSPLVLDTVTETGAPLYRLNDSSGAQNISPAAPTSSTDPLVDGSIAPHKWRETPAPTEPPIPKLPGNSSVDPDAPHYNLVVDAKGNERLVQDPNGPYVFEADPSGGFRAVADPNSPVPAPRDLRGYGVVKGAQEGQYRLIEHGSSTWREMTEIDPDVRYNVEFDECGNRMLVEVPDGDYALRKDTNGEYQAVPNPNLDGESTPPPKDFRGHAVAVGNDGKVRLFERFSLVADGRGRYEVVRDPTGPYMLQFDSAGRRRLVADPKALGADPPMNLDRLYFEEQDDGRLLSFPPEQLDSSVEELYEPVYVIHGETIHKTFADPTDAPSTRRQMAEIDPALRYDLEFDEFGNKMLVEVPDGEFALRKNAEGEYRAVPDPNSQVKIPWDFRYHAVTVGNDGKIRLFERFSLVADGRGGYEAVRDPTGPYMFQFDTTERGRLVADQKALEADDPPMNFKRLYFEERNDGRLLSIPPEQLDSSVEEFYEPVHVLRGETIHNAFVDPHTDVGRRLNDQIKSMFNLVGVPDDGMRPLADPTDAPAQHLELLSRNTSSQAVFPNAPPSHSPPDLDVTAVLNGVEDAGRRADNLGAVEPPPVRTLDDAGASAGARLDQQGARWETPANPVEFSNEGHPGAGGSARLAEPEANSHFHGAVGLGPGPARIQPPPPLPEGVVGGWSLPGLPSDFDTDRRHRPARRADRPAKRHDRAWKLQGIKGEDLRRLEAERDACKLAVAELRAGRDPRPVLQAQATSSEDPLRAQAFSDLHASLDNRSAFFYPREPGVSEPGVSEPGVSEPGGLDADILAIVDGQVPSSVDTSDLVARWGEMANDMLSFRAELAFRPDKIAPDVIQRGELYGEVERAMRDAIGWVGQGRDPTHMLRQCIVALEARKLADGTTGAAEANMLRGMVQQYRTLLEGSIDSLHLSPEWLAAVSELRASEWTGDIGAGAEAQQWLSLFTRLDGKGIVDLKADDFADGTLIKQVYADDMAILDGRLPASLDTRDMAEQWTDPGQRALP